MCFTLKRKAYEQTLKAAAVVIKEVGPPSSDKHLLLLQDVNKAKNAERDYLSISGIVSRNVTLF